MDTNKIKVWKLDSWSAFIGVHSWAKIIRCSKPLLIGVYVIHEILDVVAMSDVCLLFTHL